MSKKVLKHKLFVKEKLFGNYKNMRKRIEEFVNNNEIEVVSITSPNYILAYTVVWYYSKP